MAKKVLVTGGTGIIGTIVREDLSDRYDLTFVSRRELPEPDFLRLDVAEDYEGLRDAMAGRDAIVHLAYVEEDKATAANLKMAKNVYRAAMETVPHPRVIMASSLHVVGGHLDWDVEPYCHIAKREYARLQGCTIEKITEDCRLLPNGVYGALKAYLEVLGEFYASQGLEVVIIRFGGVRCDDRILPELGYHAFWLSRRDCAQIVSRAIDADLSQRFVRVFAVSGNEYHVHSIESARTLLGYDPQDNAEEILEA